MGFVRTLGGWGEPFESMIRFSQTDKWKDPWFRGLSPNEKLAFLYIVDSCDNAGFWEIDTGMMAFQTGLEISPLQGAIKGLARGLIIKDGIAWVRNFLRHQKNDRLNPDNNAHKQIIGILTDQAKRFSEVSEFLSERGILGANEGLLSPTGIGRGKGKCNLSSESSDSEGTLGLDLEESKKPDAQRIRVGKLLGRRESTKWSVDEMKTYRTIGKISEEDFELMEKFYFADIKVDDYRRRDVLRLVKNWPGELDKAIEYDRTHPNK